MLTLAAEVRLQLPLLGVNSGARQYEHDPNTPSHRHHDALFLPVRLRFDAAFFPRLLGLDLVFRPRVAVVLRLAAAISFTRPGCAFLLRTICGLAPAGCNFAVTLRMYSAAWPSVLMRLNSASCKWRIWFFSRLETGLSL